MTGEWVRRKLNDYQQRKARRAKPYRLTDELRAQVEDAAASLDKPVYQVRPYRGDGGVREAMDLLDGMHNVRRRWFRNVASSNIFEVAFHDEEMTFRLVPESPAAGKELRDQLYEDYPNSSVGQLTATVPPFAAEDYQYVAAANGHMHRDAHLPIRHIDVDGFSYSDADTSRDPYRKVLTKLTTDADSTVFLQVAYRPVKMGYRFRRRIKKEARGLETGGYRWIFWNRPPEEHEETAATTVRRQQTESLYQVAVRVVAAGETPQAARQRVIAAARALSEYYESSLNQGIYFEPVGSRVPRVGDESFRRFIGDVAGRKATYNGMMATTSELAGLTHLPDEYVQNPAIDWNQSKAGIPVPNHTPRFDYDAAGLDESATLHEKQVALMTEPDAGDPVYVGFGARKGTEAGVHEETLDTHAVIPGRTGVGKTTVAKNKFYQFAHRGHGVLYYDPKGDDGEDFASLVPNGREDDLVFIELGGDRDHQVAFNFMDPSTTAEPGTKAYAEALESVADGLETILPMASGAGVKSWGTRMSRVARNFARGFGRMDDPVTILDMHYALATEYGRKTYAQGLSDENIRFIEDYAQNHLAEMDDDYLEPLGGRLQQFVENPIVRDIINVRDGVDIDDAVADGKIIVVRDRTTSGTAGRMVAAALLGRIWVSIREQTNDDDRADPPHFYAMLDEFNDIASENSGIVEILENARSYGLSVIAMLQDMDAGLDDRVEKALEGQTETKLTYNPGREGFAKSMASHHSDDIDAQDLMNLSRYEFYMRTTNSRGNLTQSYKVDAFPAIDEVAPDAVRGEDETAALVDRRIREVGDPRQSPEEQQRDALFRDGMAPADEDDADSFEVTEDARLAAAQAVYDRGLRDDVAPTETAVPLDSALADDIRRYVVDATGLTDDAAEETLGTDGKLYRALLQRNSRYIRDEDGDDVETALRVTHRGVDEIRAIGEGESDGGAAHHRLLGALYDALAPRGAEVEILQQGDGSMPDARVTAGPHADETVVELCGGRGETADVEAEKSTGDEKPGQTVVNLAGVVNEGRRCLFVARPKEARRVWGTVVEPPVHERAHDADNGLTRLYNSTAKVRVDGDLAYRRGSRVSRWFRDEDSGEYVLQDDAGEEHARFASAAGVGRNADAYAAVGDDGDRDDDLRTIRAPVIPSRAFDEDPPKPSGDAWELLVVDDGDLGVYQHEADPVPLDAVLQDGGDDAADPEPVDVSDLGVPARAGDLVELLRREAGAGETVTKREAHGYADDHAGDLDVNASYKTISSWMNGLEDEGVVQRAGTSSTGAALFEVPQAPD